MIYVLDDDENLCNLIAYSIKSIGHEAQAFYKPSDMYKALKNKKPELLVLDMMLPEENGIDVLKKLRSNIATEDIAVIILTALDDEYQMVYGLDCGADDYIVKPFRPTILAAKINAVLRRIHPDNGNAFKYKEISLNTSTRKVFSDGEPVLLTSREFELLLLLMKKQGKVLSRDYILEELWGTNAFVETRIIDSHIRSVRAKLGACGKYISSVRGIGYCLGEEDD